MNAPDTWSDIVFAFIWGAIAFAFVLAHFYAEPLRWWMAYLRPKVAWSRTRDLFNATALASYLLPFKLGLPLRLMLISRVTAMDRFSVAGLMAIDSAVSIVFWTLAGVTLGGQLVLDRVRLPPTWLWICLGVVAIAIAIALWRGRLKRLLAKFTALRAGIHERPERTLLAVALTALDVATYGARHACMALAVGVEPSLAADWAVWGIVATFTGMASGLPMGLVGYDATILLLAAAHGITPGQAAVVIALNRGMSFAAAAIAGLPASRRLGMGTSFRDLTSKLKELISGK